MLHVSWKERYSINFRGIDGQHRQLLSICNDLIDLLPQNPDITRIKDIFTRLKDYALTHFKYEEGYMQKAAYPGFKSHQSQHKAFIKKLIEYSNQFEYTEEYLREIIEFLKNWYVGHIMQSDKAYQPYLHKLGDLQD